ADLCAAQRPGRVATLDAVELRDQSITLLAHTAHAMRSPRPGATAQQPLGMREKRSRIRRYRTHPEGAVHAVRRADAPHDDDRPWRRVQPAGALAAAVPAVASGVPFAARATSICTVSDSLAPFCCQ